MLRIVCVFIHVPVSVRMCMHISVCKGMHTRKRVLICVYVVCDCGHVRLYDSVWARASV